MKVSDYQNRVLLIPETMDIFQGGGRGGGKSQGMGFLALRHIQQHGEQARVLYIRKTYPSLADFELLCRELFNHAYGGQARYNMSAHVWRFPNGGYMELGQLEGPQDYSKYQGRSFTLLLVDEAGEFASPADIDRLRSNLRGPAGVPIRTVISANPGGVGHAWLTRRYIKTPWQSFTEEASGRAFVNCPSTFLDNPGLDHAQYERQLKASCPTDPELLRAWLDGDWHIARGAYFASSLDESRNMIEPWDRIPPGFRSYLSHDFGSTAPSVTYLVLESDGEKGPDGKYYPRGSLILFDELATVDPDDPTKGLGWNVDILAEEIKAQLCTPWKIHAQGVCDDACFAATGHSGGSLAEEFQRAGVYFTPAKKGDRIAGWQRMKRFLMDAGKPDVPGMYISRNCRYFWETVPYLGRDKRRVEDLDSTGPDHAADAARYAFISSGKMQQVQLYGR